LKPPRRQGSQEKKSTTFNLRPKLNRQSYGAFKKIRPNDFENMPEKKIEFAAPCPAH